MNIKIKGSRKEGEEDEEDQNESGMKDEPFIVIMKHDVVLGLIEMQLLPRIR